MAEHVSLLGSQVAPTYREPSASILESFPNPGGPKDYSICFFTEEFTSLCPKTGQPDFASVDIEYTPDKFCVETKSLKLYLTAYRNEKAFMEDTLNRIYRDLLLVIQPRGLRLVMKFRARGGISTRLCVGSLVGIV